MPEYLLKKGNDRLAERIGAWGGIAEERAPICIEVADRDQIIGGMEAGGMEPITWNQSFSVGIARLDKQHQHLIQMINRLMADPGARTESETISDLLNAMTNYAQTHFEAEEELMRQYGYPQLDEHTSQHNTFRRRTADLCMATMHDDGAVPEIMIEYLRDWLVQHILRSDMAYRPFFHERGIE